MVENWPFLLVLFVLLVVLFLRLSLGLGFLGFSLLGLGVVVGGALVVDGLADLHGSLVDVTLGGGHGFNVVAVQGLFGLVECGKDLVLGGLVQLVFVLVEGLLGFVERAVKFVFRVDSSLNSQKNEWSELLSSFCRLLWKPQLA